MCIVMREAIKPLIGVADIVTTLFLGFLLLFSVPPFPPLLFPPQPAVKPRQLEALSVFSTNLFQAESTAAKSIVTASTFLNFNVIEVNLFAMLVKAEKLFFLVLRPFILQMLSNFLKDQWDKILT